MARRGPSGQRLPAVSSKRRVLGGETATSYAAQREITREFRRLLGRPAGDPEGRALFAARLPQLRQVLTEIMRFPSMVTRAARARDDRSRVARASSGRPQRGRGIIFVSAHYGISRSAGRASRRRSPTSWPRAREHALMTSSSRTASTRTWSSFTRGRYAPRARGLKRNEMVGFMMDLGPRAHALERPGHVLRRANRVPGSPPHWLALPVRRSSSPP